MLGRGQLDRLETLLRSSTATSTSDTGRSSTASASSPPPRWPTAIGWARTTATSTRSGRTDRSPWWPARVSPRGRAPGRGPCGPAAARSSSARLHWRRMLMAELDTVVRDGVVVTTGRGHFLRCARPSPLPA
jgi:hypothetical protein